VLAPDETVRRYAAAFTPGGDNSRFLCVARSAPRSGGGSIFFFRSRIDMGPWLDAFAARRFATAAEADAEFARVIAARGADARAWLRRDAPLDAGAGAGAGVGDGARKR